MVQFQFLVICSLLKAIKRSQVNLQVITQKQSQVFCDLSQEGPKADKGRSGRNGNSDLPISGREKDGVEKKASGFSG